jgi:hypothetical protein
MTKIQAVVKQVEMHESSLKDEYPEEILDESADPLEESGRTVDTSDEEIDESVADEIQRFEDNFVGIHKRYRVINRIGEGKFRIGPPYARLHSVLTHARRYFFYCLQGRGSRVPQIRKPLGCGRA